MSQSCACSLFLVKTNEKDACSRVPQSSSLPQSCAKEKSSGVEIFSKGEGMTVLYVYSANNSACALTFCILALRILPKRTLLLSDSRTRRDWEDKFPFYINKRNTNSSKSRLWSSVLSQFESDLHRSILCSPLDVLTTSVVTTEICVYLKPVPFC